MVKCQAPLVVSKFLTSKCKEIVIVVLRAIISFLSNAVNTKHPTNNTLVLNQVKNKFVYIYLIMHFQKIFIWLLFQILGNITGNATAIKNLMSLLPEHPLVCKIIYFMCLVKHSNTTLHQTQIIIQIVNVLKKENNICK